MVRPSLPKGVHRVARKLACGAIRYHFYAWRGGPNFWQDSLKFPIDPEFYVAFAAAVERPRPADYLVPELVDEFLSSTALAKARRSQEDQRYWLLKFGDHFAKAPVKVFEDPRSRGDMNEWRALWKHSPKSHDSSGTHAVRLLNWAVQEGKLREHFCHKLHRIYEVDRSEIVWTPADREAFDAIAPEFARRILCVACETGLRPGDLVRVSLSHVETTEMGRRLRIRTKKRNRWAHIPVTPELSKVIDSTPKGQMLLLHGARGRPLTERGASDLVKAWRDKAGLSPDLRLQDARGTAATRLLNAGLSLAHIANHMGWSVRYASQVIEHYARVSPDETDAVLIKLEEAKRGAR